MQLRKNHPAISLAANRCFLRSHSGRNIDLADRYSNHTRSGLSRDVVDDEARRKIGDDYTLPMPKHFLGGECQRVILTNRDSLVGDKGQTIDIRVNGHSDVAVGILYELLQLSQVFSDRLGRSWKAPVWLHVDGGELATEQFQQNRHERTARAANTVQA